MVTDTPTGGRRALRRLEHGSLLVGGAVVVALAVLATFGAEGPGTQRASLATGYVSLVAIGISLLLGPLRVLQARPNPVTTDLRRDVGIVAVVTGVAHVLLAIQHHFGGSIRLYFFVDQGLGLGSMRTDNFGLSVWLGVGATLVLVVLGALSNDLSLRRMGRRRWKRLQRLNYLLVVVSLVHTALFWSVLHRSGTVVTIALGATAVVLAAQAAGTLKYRAAARAKGSGPRGA